jgi:threonine dehydrogenase-like Zn-dependent dehydrogenase
MVGLRCSPAPGHVIVQDNRTGKVSYWQKEYHQSAGDADGVSTADYIHAMFAFLHQAGSKNVLIIGCGGGTLATMLRKSGVAVTMVDIHKLSFDIARDYFSLPADVPCHVADGIDYLKKHHQRHDALVVDAFGEDGMPAKFKTAAFFKLAKSRMKPRGALFLMNVIVDDDDDQTPDRMVRLLRRQWSKVRLLDTDGWVDRNAVIVAGSVAKLRKPKLMMPPRTGAKKLKRELAVLDWRTLRNKVGR